MASSLLPNCIQVTHSEDILEEVAALLPEDHRKPWPSDPDR